MSDTTEESTGSGEGTTSEEVHQEAPDYVKIASEKGWKPFSEYEGNPSGWVDAAEFVKREPLFDKIKNQSKELREMRKTVDAMSTHFQKNVEAEVQKRLQVLDEKRDEAIELGDKAAVKEIDKEIRIEQQNIQQQQNAPKIDPLITEFVDKNAWFNSNESMREFALAYNKSFLLKHPNDLKESLDKTLAAVKKAFPEEFTAVNPRRESVGAVEEGSGGKSPEKGKYTMNRLSEDQRRVYDQMVKRNGILSHDEFFKDLDAIGELA